MGAPRFQPTFHQAQAAPAHEGAVIRHGGPRPGLRAAAHIDPVLLRVLEKKTLQGPFRRAGNAQHGAEIALVQLPVPDLLVEDAQGLRILGGDDDAPGVAVDAVAQRRGEGVFLPGPPLAAQQQVGLDVGQQGPLRRLPLRVMAEDAGGLVRQEDVLVLIDDAQLRRRHLAVGVFVAGLLEKFVVYI